MAVTRRRRTKKPLAEKRQCIAYHIASKVRCPNFTRAKDSQLCKAHRPRLRLWELLFRS